MQQVYRTLEPGGYVELAELGFVLYSDDNSMPKNHGAKVFLETLSDAMEKIGRPAATSTQMKKYLVDAGFVDIEVTDAKQPYGPWPKDRKLKTIGAMVGSVRTNAQEAFC